ncbi:pyridoxal phosphate-dependent transferase [Podospora appendiculata]|uniref:Pyridoxal phosphate-dependent transferase n=1 Tax=Podospora appendiculata TaxID=314037 RepID=A0AAE0XCV9_9PEZI|nr:pyridoxal phosphate-dependent transferase [Podospora appendiculata]
MQTGYPRFFIPRAVDRLVEKLLNRLREESTEPLYREQQRHGLPVATRRQAHLFYDFLGCQDEAKDAGAVIQIVGLSGRGNVVFIDPTNERVFEQDRGQEPPLIGTEDIFMVTYPTQLVPAARSFWQHTGYGISSRRATFWLEWAPFFGSNPSGCFDPRILHPDANAANSWSRIKRRFLANRIYPSLDDDAASLQTSDVFLYPTGMTAITEVAAALFAIQPGAAPSCGVAVFGFLYVDTFKVLSRVLGMETRVYKYDELEIDRLENELEEGLKIDAVFTEFPGNPLLRCPNIPRLRQLSIKHWFVLVVDDTVGTCASVKLLPHCDVVCTSLTKMFSGACNVMGGAVTLAPESYYHDQLQTALLKTSSYRSWFPQDVAVMDKNSQDFVRRVIQASRNALPIVELIRGHPTVEQVFYPFGGESQEMYEFFRVRGTVYGFLLSIKFISPACAIAFYNALHVAKGPSLGTNFTLCCAYTLLAHSKELDWAAENDVEEHLIRISVGLEGRTWLEPRVKKALLAASVTVYSMATVTA